MSELSEESESSRKPLHWRFITSHGLVLLYVASHPDARIREIAEELDLTERRVAEVIRDLKCAAVLDIRRDGRRNHYQLNSDACLTGVPPQERRLLEVVAAGPNEMALSGSKTSHGNRF